MGNVQIISSHPRLAWLRGAEKNRVVPARVVEKIKGLTSIELAQQFVEDAGFSVSHKDKRITESVFSVSLMPLQEVEGYYGPQIIFSTIDCEVVPIGTMMLNCLLPKIEDLSEAERVFQVYQKTITAFSQSVEAFPFACITGHKIERGSPFNALDRRGFRLFFGPKPEKQAMLCDMIEKKLEITLFLKGQEEVTDESRRLGREVVRMKFCKYGDGVIGHSILEDIMYYTLGTVFERF